MGHNTHSAARWVSTFISEWLANVAGHPCIVCDTEQLHTAYSRWSDRNGTPVLPAAQFVAELATQPVRLLAAGSDLTMVIPATLLGHAHWVDPQRSMELFAAHLQGFTAEGLRFMEQKRVARLCTAGAAGADQ